MVRTLRSSSEKDPFRLFFGGPPLSPLPGVGAGLSSGEEGLSFVMLPPFALAPLAPDPNHCPKEVSDPIRSSSLSWTGGDPPSRPEVDGKVTCSLRGGGPLTGLLPRALSNAPSAAAFLATVGLTWLPCSLSTAPLLERFPSSSVTRPDVFFLIVSSASDLCFFDSLTLFSARTKFSTRRTLSRKSCLSPTALPPACVLGNEEIV
mmetsp:Transcript_40/g.167  ORF Transcript_40/g.167 Transcript_40/m.167 type:complete len:205 (-) Transcript_40:1280-1894(-)